MRLRTRHIVAIGVEVAVVLALPMAGSASPLAHHHLRNHHASPSFRPDEPKPTKAELIDHINEAILFEDQALDELDKKPVDKKKVHDLIDSSDNIDLRDAEKKVKQLGLPRDVEKDAEKAIKDARREDDKALKALEKGNLDDVKADVKEALDFKEDALDILGVPSRTSTPAGPPPPPSLRTGQRCVASPNPVHLVLNSESSGEGSFAVACEGLPSGMGIAFSMEAGPGCTVAFSPATADADFLGRVTTAVSATGACHAGSFVVAAQELNPPRTGFVAPESFVL